MAGHRAGCSRRSSFPSGHASSVTAFGGIVIVLVIDAGPPLQHPAARRTSRARSLVVVVCADRVLLGRHYPSDVIGGRPARRRDGAARARPSTTRCRAATRRASSRCRRCYLSARRLAVVLNPIKVEDVGQFRAIVTAMAAEAGWSTADLALHDRRGPGHRDGRGRPRSRAPTWCSSAAATAPCARSAPSSPAPASRSGSSRPAPATCWPATSTSRSTCGPRSTSRSPARTGPSTWSRSPATASRTPTSW